MVAAGVPRAIQSCRLSATRGDPWRRCCGRFSTNSTRPVCYGYPVHSWQTTKGIQCTENSRPTTGDGKIHVGELQKGLRGVGLGMSTEAVTEFIEQSDVDSDGRSAARACLAPHALHVAPNCLCWPFWVHPHTLVQTRLAQ